MPGDDPMGQQAPPRKRTFEQLKATNKSKLHRSLKVTVCAVVGVESIKSFIKSKKDFRRFKQEYKQFYMPATRCFNASKLPSSFELHDLEFAQQVEAGVKILLPRKGACVFKVPRYPEVSLTFFKTFACSCRLPRFTRSWSNFKNLLNTSPTTRDLTCRTGTTSFK